MSDIIRIVHLSDFHWKKNNESTFSKQLFEPLLKSLNKENSERKIDLIFITGDLLDKGNSGFEKASDAFSEFEKEVISKIITKLNFEKKNIILCPGNHDMDTKQDQDFADVGLEGKLTTQETVLKYMENIRENKFKDGIKRILPFKDFEKQFYQNKTETEISYFESIHRRTINGTTIGIVALNSAWRYYNPEDKENNIIIGRTHLTNALSKLENCSINILLSHYNTENFATFERKDLEHTISENYQIQLYGHSHSQNVFTKQNVTSDIYFTDVSRGLIVNNITNNDINYQNGYSIIDFDSTNSEIKLYLKVYSRDRNEFVNDTCTLGDKGVRTFELQKKQDELKELHYVSNKIYTSFIEGKMDHD